MSDTQSDPITPLSLAAILTFIPFKKRQEWSSRIPGVADVNRTTPYKFEKVSYSYQLSWYSDLVSTLFCRLPIGQKTIHVRLDNFRWEFTFVRGNVVIKLPNGKKLTEEGSHDIVDRFLDFFIGRRNTKINQLKITDYQGTAPFISEKRFIPKVNKLSLKFTEAYKTGLILSLEYFEFKEILLIDLKQNPVVLDELKKLRTDDLKIWGFNSDNLDFDVKTLKIRDDDSAQEDRFIFICEQFKRGKFQAGSNYRAVYPNVSFAYWDRLKAELGCVEKRYNNMDCLSVPIANTGNELNIWITRMDYAIFKADVSPLGTAKSVPEMMEVEEQPDTLVNYLMRGLSACIPI